MIAAKPLARARGSETASPASAADATGPRPSGSGRRSVPALLRPRKTECGASSSFTGSVARAAALLLTSILLAVVGCGSGSTEAKKADAPPAAPAFFKVDPATSGTISGKVLFTGKKPAPKRIVMDEEAACVRMHKGGLFEEEVRVNKDGTLANVFVYIQAGLEGKTFEPAANPVTIDQKGCRFEPRVFGIRTGQTLKVTNSDPVSHNIHPVPKNNREWNQGQAPEAAPLEREFARPEIMVPVKCNVHSWMRSYIGVVDHPYFAVSGADGAFELKNVPPGEYTFEVWHEKFGTQRRKVTVAPSGKAQADFTFTGE